MEKYLNSSKSIKLLDVGCWSAQLHKALSLKHDYYGIDVDQNVVESIKGEFKKDRIKCASATKIPYKSNLFDVVVFSEVLEHLPAGTEFNALGEICRVLKKSGILFLTTPNDYLLSKILDPAYFLKGHRHYHKDQLTQLLNNSCYEIISLHKIGNTWHSFGHIIHLIYKHTLGKSTPNKISLFFEKLSRKHLYSGKKGYLSLFVIAKNMYQDD